MQLGLGLREKDALAGVQPWEPAGVGEGRKQAGKARKGARQEGWLRWEPRSSQGCNPPWEAVQSSGAVADANCSSSVHPLCLALLHGSVHTPALPKANVRKQRLFVTLFKPVCK